jgi:nucleoside-diphosphate-sugar epimerase
MKLLVIGGTGFMSSALVEAFVEAGHAVTILTRGQRPVAFPASVRCLTADRQDTSAFRDAVAGQTFDAVFDAICYTPQHAQQDIDLFAGQVGRLVMISTDFVYTVGPRPLPIPEDTPREAPTDYGRNKALSEDLFFAANDRLPVTILRPPHIIGAGGLFGTGSLQGRDASLPARLRRAEPILLLDGGALLIQPVDRADIAAACLAVLTSQATAGQAYNMAGPEAVPTRRYYELIADILGVELRVACLPSDVFLTAYPDRASFARHRVYSHDKLIRDGGFRPSKPLEQSLREMLIWLEANPPAGADAPATDTEKELLALFADRDARACALLR